MVAYLCGFGCKGDRTRLTDLLIFLFCEKRHLNGWRFFRFALFPKKLWLSWEKPPCGVVAHKNPWYS